MVPFDCAQGDTDLGNPRSPKICRNGSPTPQAKRPKRTQGRQVRRPYGWFVTLARAIIFRVYRSPSTVSW